MNYCINLKKRKNKPFCKLLNKEISLSECYNCVSKEYKKNTTQKNKHKKLDNTRFSIITKDLNHCYLCGKNREALHEVFYGAYRHVSIKYGMVIPLCENCHTKGFKSVHRDRSLDIALKKKAQDIFEKYYSHDLFMKEFIIDYKEKYKEDN